MKRLLLFFVFAIASLSASVKATLVIDFISANVQELDLGGDEGPSRGLFRINAKITSDENVFVSKYDANAIITLNGSWISNPDLMITPISGDTGDDTTWWAKIDAGDSRTFAFSTIVDAQTIGTTGVYRFELYEVGWSYANYGLYDQLAAVSLPTEDFRTPPTILYAQVPEPATWAMLTVSVVFLGIISWKNRSSSW